MKLKIKLVLIVAVIAMFASVATVLAANNQHSKMHVFDDPNAVSGTEINGSQAVLTRGDDSVTISVKTTRLPVGAYTTWWVIWNNIGDCSDGTGDLACGAGDLGSASNSVFFASGGVTNRNGVGRFGATLPQGGFGIATGGQILINNGGGLGDAQTSEVHYIIRYHGPASDDPNDLISQTTTVGGLCGSVPDVGDCYDPQAVGFPPAP